MLQILIFLLVINAAHTFYNGTTTLPISEEDRTPRKRISKTLNMTTNPEEKRKIIGDTFVKVRCTFQRFSLVLQRPLLCRISRFESSYFAGGERSYRRDEPNPRGRLLGSGYVEAWSHWERLSSCKWQSGGHQNASQRHRAHPQTQRWGIWSHTTHKKFRSRPAVPQM